MAKVAAKTKPATTKAENAKNAVVLTEKVRSNVVSETRPDYMKAGAGKLNSNFDSSDMVRPSLRITQATSPQVAEMGAPIGELWHTGAGESLGDEVVFSIISARKKYIIFAERGADTNVLARSDDGVHWDKPNTDVEILLKGEKKKRKYNTGADVKSSGLWEFGSSKPEDEDSQPVATLVYEFLVWLPHRPELGPTILSLARTQIKPGKRLVTAMETRQRMADIFGCAFLARTVKDSRGADEFYNFAFQNAGFIAEEARDVVAGYAEQFKDFRGADADYGETAGGSTSKRDISEIKQF